MVKVNSYFLSLYLLFATVLVGGAVTYAVWQPLQVDFVSDLVVPIIVVSLVGGIVGWLLVERGNLQERKALGHLFIASLGLRMLFALVVNQWSLANGGFGSYSIRVGYDDGWYQRLAVSIVDSWHGGGDLLAIAELGNSPDVGYGYFLAFIYFLVGTKPIVAMLVGGVIGAASVVAVYRLSLLIVSGRKDVALAAGWIAAIMPRLIWSSSVIVKDVLAVPLVLLVPYFTLKLTHRKDVARSLVGLVASSALLAIIRLPVATLIVPLCLVYSLVVGRHASGLGISSRVMAVTFALVLISGFLLVGSETLFSVGRISEVARGAFVPLNEREGFLAEATSESLIVSLSDLTLPVLIERPYMLLVVMGIVLIMPFPPFQFYPDPSGVASSQGNVVWYFVLPFAAWGIWVLWREKNRDAQFLVFLLAVLWLSIVFISYGTQSRYVIMMMPFVAVLAGFGFVERRGATRWLVGYVCLFSGLTLFYLFLKYF